MTFSFLPPARSQSRYRGSACVLSKLCQVPPLKLRHYGGIQMRILLLLYKYGRGVPSYRRGFCTTCRCSLHALQHSLPMGLSAMHCLPQHVANKDPFTQCLKLPCQQPSLLNCLAINSILTGDSLSAIHTEPVV